MTAEPSPLRLVRDPERPATVPTVELPAEVADRLLRQRAPVAVPLPEVLADMHFRLRRLGRENGKLRQRVAVLEQVLSDQPEAHLRRQELRQRVFDKRHDR